MAEKHSHMTPAGRAVWMTERLWAAARDLPVSRVAIADIPEFDQDCWFAPNHVPTMREVTEHARRIAAADLAHPIIFSADGSLMDGGHRISRAWLEGRTEIDAVRFETDPEPDEIRPG